MREVGAGIIAHNGKIFIAQRPEGKPLPNLWEFPGGKQEEGETITQCLKRELKEELGVEAEIGEYLMSTSYKYDSGEFRIHAYRVYLKEDAKITLYVHQKSAWVTPAEMEKYKFPPADADIITKLKNLF